MLLDIIELTPLQNKGFFSSFCMVGRNHFDSSVWFQTFFRHCRGIQFFKLFRSQGKSLICRGKNSLKANLNPLIISMHLRGFSRWYFAQVWFVFNLDVYCIFCIKLIYCGKTFDLNYVFYVNSIFKMFLFSEKWPI